MKNNQIQTRQQTLCKIDVLDSHTGGEPTRLVLRGFPDLGTGSMQARLEYIKKHCDDWRRGILLEPRGHEVLVGALLVPPVDKKSTAGVIFFNNTGYLGMCGHGTIGLLASLEYLGQAVIGQHIIETPVGNITAELLGQGRVRIENVPAYRYKKDVSVKVPALSQTVIGDIAWGGNWFFLVKNPQFELHINKAKELEVICTHIKEALQQAGITGAHGDEIDHIELFSEHPEADSQNFVLCPGNVYDRSPCGTGTSAKLACLAADGALQAGEVWYQAGIVGSVFQGQYRWAEPNEVSKLTTDTADMRAVIPTIEGQAFISAETTLVFDPADPFYFGITL